jgi:hypothetical protein
MRHFAAISLAVFCAVFAAAMIVKSNQKWEDNADNLMRTLTPDVLIAHCGQPATDIAWGSSNKNRQMFYPTSRDKSIGLIFTFLYTPNTPSASNWTYLSSHLGTPNGKRFMEIENVKGSNSWAIIEFPCLEAKR